MKYLKQQSGFALSELLVYVGILGIVSGLATVLLSNSISLNKKEITEGDITRSINYTIASIQNIIHHAGGILNDAGSTSSTLRLFVTTIPDSTIFASTTPILTQNSSATLTLFLKNNALYTQLGANSPESITTGDIEITDLSFRTIIQPPAQQSVEVSLGIQSTQLIQGKKITRSIKTAIAKGASDIYFESSIIPSVTETHTIGEKTPPSIWRTLYANSVCLGSTPSCKSSWSELFNGVSGSGTAGKMARWISSTTLGDSIFYDNGSQVYAGTTSAQTGYLLSLGGSKGGIKSSITHSTYSGGYFSNTATNGYALKTDNGNVLLATASGTKVGVGTSTPAQTFDVNGKVRATGFCIGASCKTSWAFDDFWQTSGSSTIPVLATYHLHIGKAPDSIPLGNHILHTQSENTVHYINFGYSVPRDSFTFYPWTSNLSIGNIDFVSSVKKRFAVGENVEALSTSSFAGGDNSISSIDYSFAFGDHAEVSGGSYPALALGSYAKAKAYNTALGDHAYAHTGQYHNYTIGTWVYNDQDNDNHGAIAFGNYYPANNTYLDPTSPLLIGFGTTGYNGTPTLGNSNALLSMSSSGVTINSSSAGTTNATGYAVGSYSGVSTSFKRPATGTCTITVRSGLVTANTCN